VIRNDEPRGYSNGGGCGQAETLVWGVTAR